MDRSAIPSSGGNAPSMEVYGQQSIPSATLMYGMVGNHGATVISASILDNQPAMTAERPHPTAGRLDGEWDGNG